MELDLGIPKLTAPPLNYATGDELREQIHRHLRQHPRLAAAAIAAALNLSGGGPDRTLRMLKKMEQDGEADRVPGRRSPGDRRPVTLWVAT